MNKKKMLTSLALAGILTAGVMGANVNANTNGVYNKLVSGTKPVVPYIVEAGKESVTINDIIADFGSITNVNGVSGLAGTKEIKTGDYFTSGGTKYYALVYGDVNKDGVVDAFDAKDILQYSVGNKTLDNMAIEAGDVVRDDDTDSFDASQILKFSVGTESTLTTLPAKENQDTVDANYTLTAEKVNNVNKAAVPVKITIEKELTSDATVELKLYKADAKTATEVSVPDIKLPKYTSQVTTTNGTTPLTINPSELVDGTYVLKLLDSSDNVLATTTVVKDTVISAGIIDAKAVREDGVTASATLNSLTGTIAGTTEQYKNISKVYFSLDKTKLIAANLVDADNDGILKANDKDDADATKAQKDTIAVYEASADSTGKVTVSDIALEEGTGKTNLYYVIVDEDGNMGTLYKEGTTPELPASVEIPANITNKQVAPTSLVYDNSEENEDKLIYIATFATKDYRDAAVYATNENKAWTVTLYKNGKAIASANNIQATAGDGAKEVKLDLTTAFVNKNYTNSEGTYTIKASLNGDNTNILSSDEVPSSGTDLRVTALGSVIPEIKLDEDNNKVYLTFNSNDDDSYKYAVYTYDTTTKEWELIDDNKDVNGNIKYTDATTQKTSYKIQLTTTANTIYKATVYADASNIGDISVCDSEIKETNHYITVDAIKTITMGDNYATLLVPSIDVANSDSIYSVDVRLDSNKKAVSGVNFEIVKDKNDKVIAYDNNGDANANGTYIKIKVTGLTSNVWYQFRLNASYEGASGSTKWSDRNMTLSAVPSLENGLVVSNELTTLEKAGSIGKYEGHYYVDGKDIGTNGTGYDATVWTNAKTLIDSVDAEALGATVSLVTDSDDKTTATIDLSKIKDVTLTVPAFNYVNIIPADKNAATITGVTNTEINLGASTVAQIIASADSKINLAKGANIKATALTVTIPANSSVTINGIVVNTDVEIEVDITNSTIFAIAQTNTSNNLTFNDTKASGLTVKFEGATANTVVNPGTINITSKGAVTVDTAGQYVTADITLNTTDQNVDLTAYKAKLEGKKVVNMNVTTTDSKKVTGKLATALASAQNVTDGKATYDEISILGKLIADDSNVLTIVAKEYTSNDDEVENWSSKEIAGLNALIKKIVKDYNENVSIKFTFEANGTVIAEPVSVEVTVKGITTNAVSVIGLNNATAAIE